LPIDQQRTHDIFCARRGPFSHLTDPQLALGAFCDDDFQQQQKTFSALAEMPYFWLKLSVTLLFMISAAIDVPPLKHMRTTYPVKMLLT